MPLPATSRSLPAGSYVLPDFEPRTQFSLGEGWHRPHFDRSFLVDLSPVGDDDSLISIFTVLNLVDPARTYPSLAAVRRPEAAISPPDDLVAWLKSHPNLAVTSSSSFVTASGLKGHRLEVSLRGSNARCPEECSALFHFGRTVFVFLPLNRNRLYLISAGEQTVVLAVESRSERFDEAAATAEQIIASLKVGSP